MQKWFERNLSIAREILKNSELLEEFLGGFKGYENKRYRNVKNAILFMCLPAVGGGVDPKSINRLNELEKTLELFDFRKWNISKRNYLKSRLASEDYIQSFSAVSELELASEMVRRFGKENVELYPMLDCGGFSDICVKVDSKNVFLEIGNLAESLPDSKIQKILNASAKHLGEKVDELAYLCIIIDTAEIVTDDKGRIDVESSIEKLNSEIDMLAIHKLAGFEGFFDFSDIDHIVTHQSLYKKIEKLLTPNDQILRLLDIISKEKVKSWLDCFDTSLLKKAKIAKGIISGKGKSTLLVEIHTEEFFPSTATNLELKSFLNHLIRHIETQVAGQLQPKAPNVVVVRGWHWTMWGLGFDTLYKSLQRFFERIKEEYLSGVAYEPESGKAVYVSNDYAKTPSLLEKGDIDKLGFRLLTPERL